MKTTANNQMDRATAIRMTGQTINVGPLDQGKGAIVFTGRTDASPAERASTIVAGASLGLAFAFTGVVLGLAMRT